MRDEHSKHAVAIGSNQVGLDYFPHQTKRMWVLWPNPNWTVIHRRLILSDHA